MTDFAMDYTTTSVVLFAAQATGWYFVLQTVQTEFYSMLLGGGGARGRFPGAKAAGT
jgi:hypothetical protein